jgi:hypothetical protein
MVMGMAKICNCCDYFDVCLHANTFRTQDCHLWKPKIVLCKECVHCEVTPDNLRWCRAWAGINGMGDEGFCNYGEMRTDE